MHTTRIILAAARVAMEFGTPLKEIWASDLKVIIEFYDGNHIGLMYDPKATEEAMYAAIKDEFEHSVIPYNRNG
jgi:hypothetical protein